jgi:hypothetical protein
MRRKFSPLINDGPVAPDEVAILCPSEFVVYSKRPRLGGFKSTVLTAQYTHVTSKDLSHGHNIGQVRPR